VLELRRDERVLRARGAQRARQPADPGAQRGRLVLGALAGQARGAPLQDDLLEVDRICELRLVLRLRFDSRVE
jgi:hypothetical protein